MSTGNDGKMKMEREVLANRDKSAIKEHSTTVTTNVCQIVLAAVARESHHIFDVFLTGTTGAGAAEALEIIDGTTRRVKVDFTVGTDRELHFGGIGFVGEQGGAVTIKVSATELTAAELSVVGYTK